MRDGCGQPSSIIFDLHRGGGDDRETAGELKQDVDFQGERSGGILK